MAKLGDELVSLTREQLQGVSFHPARALVIVFTQEAVFYFPQVLVGIDEIQDLGEI